MAARTINHAGSVNAQGQATIQIGDHYQIHNHEVDPTTGKESLRESLLDSLHTCNYRERKDRNPKRAHGTCVWFVAHSRFQHWQDQGFALL